MTAKIDSMAHKDIACDIIETDKPLTRYIKQIADAVSSKPFNFNEKISQFFITIILTQFF